MADVGFPQINTPFVDDRGILTQPWYHMLAGLWNAKSKGTRQIVVVDFSESSPLSFRAPADGTMFVNGGDVVGVSFSRDQQNFYLTGMTQGALSVSAGDTIQINYTTAPTAVFVPF